MNWAVVIGVDRYWTERACLKGACRDAVRMRDWLLEPHGGNVPVENLVTLLSPLPGQEPTGFEWVEATSDAIVVQISELVARSGGQGERLFVYYAGHGVTARIDHRDEDALLASDFSDVLTNNSLSLRTLWEYLETTQFKDQFLFADACRNVPVEEVEFEVGRWPRPRRRDPGLPPTQQFVLYATSPGLRAVELRAEAGNERGAFTDELLHGLSGAGAAKAWSPGLKAYEVRWERLVHHVTETVGARRMAVGAGPAQEVFQVPQAHRITGDLVADSNPVLGDMAGRDFPSETLHVHLSPTAAAQGGKVVVYDERTIQVGVQIAGRGPVTFELPPRTYSVHAVASSYAEEIAPPLELYEPAEVKLKLERSAPGGGATSSGTHVVVPAAGESVSGIVAVRSGDPLAPVEIADAGGSVVSWGNGAVVARDQPAGFYRVRARSPENEAVEQRVELRAGLSDAVRLDLPRESAGRALGELIAATGAAWHDDGTLDLGEDASHVSWPRPSTILTLAAGVALHGDDTGSTGLAGVGLRSIRRRVPKGSASGLHVLALVDDDDPQAAAAELAARRLTVWPQDAPVPDGARPFEARGPVAGLGELAVATAAGGHWLAIESPGSRPAVLALAQLPGRLTMLTLVLEPRTVRSYQYLPALDPDGSALPQELRRQELLQRVALGGRPEGAFEIARSIVHEDCDDPMALLLAGYLYVRVGRALELGGAAAILTERFGGLADGHVLAGEHMACAGEHEAAAAAFRTAIETGVPITGEGLTRLLEGMRRYDLDHPRRALVQTVFERHRCGSMWAAWTPAGLTRGEVLTG